jgi:hypothetical protein
VRIKDAETWAAVSTGDDRYLIYGPRVGRLYLLSSDDSSSATLLGIIGLSGATKLTDVVDPVDLVLHSLSDLKKRNLPEVAFSLRCGYRLARISYHFIPFRTAAKMAGRMAPLFRSLLPHRDLTPTKIGLIVHAIEEAVGSGSCYPRALLTAYLSLSSGRRCVLVVGSLVPTRKMHVWCSIDSALPYEPMPEHYMYKPVWMLALTP